MQFPRTLRWPRGRRSAPPPSAASLQSFNHDALEIARRRRVRHAVPLQQFSAFVYLAFTLRILAMAEAGPGGYAYRIAEMRDGTLVERGAAVVMQADPVSQRIAMKLRRGVRAIVPG